MNKVLLCLALLFMTYWFEKNHVDARSVSDEDDANDNSWSSWAKINHPNTLRRSMLDEVAEEDPWATWSTNNNPSTRNRVLAVDKNEEEKIWASWASVNQNKKRERKQNKTNKNGKTKKKKNKGKKKSGKRPEEGNLFEGDMILNKEQMEFLEGNSNRNARKNFKWPNGIVNYMIDSSVSSKDHSFPSIVDETLANLEKKLSGCIKFQKTNSGPRVKVVSRTRGGKSACYSYVGYQGGVQELELGGDKQYGCWTTGIIEHEFLHAIGIYHEQSRSDRHNYLTVQDGTNGTPNNILPGKEHNFRSYPKSKVSHFGLPYNYYSVMHYGKTAFGIKGSNGKKKITIVTRDPAKQNIIGQRDGVSNGDIQLINRFYGCGEYFYLVSELTGLVLDVKWSGKKAGTYLHMWGKNGTPAQLWKWDGDLLISKLNGFALDVKYGQKHVGNRVWMWPKNWTPAQRWHLDGPYLVSKLNNLRLDVQNGKTHWGNNVWMWRENGTPAQKWIIEYV